MFSLVLISTFYFALSSTAQPRTPLYRAFLQSNLNGNGNLITNLPSLSVTGTVTALNYSGSASNLTDIPATTNYTVLNADTTRYSTNAHPSATNSLNMARLYADFTATTAMSLTNFSNVDATRQNSSVLLVTNGSGGDLILYLNGSARTTDGARSLVLSNNTLTVISAAIYGRRFTNVVYRTFY